MLYHKIKQLCLEKRITIAELERELEFGNGTIRKWDLIKPSIERVDMIAKHFGVSIDYLIREDSSVQRFNDSNDLLDDYETLSSKQKELVRCYIAIIKNGQTV